MEFRSIILMTDINQKREEEKGVINTEKSG